MLRGPGLVLRRIGLLGTLASMACFSDAGGDGGNDGDGSGTGGGSGTSAPTDAGGDGGDAGDAGDDGSGSGSTGGGSHTDTDGGGSSGDDGDSSTGGDTGGTSGGGTDETTGDGGDACPSGSICVGQAPIGWMGPAVVFQGPPDQAPACPGTYPDTAMEAHRDPSVPPATCSACSCGTPTGVECSPPEMRLYYANDCNEERSAHQLLGHDQCTVLVDPQGRDSFNSDPVTATPGTGSCTPSGGTPTLPPWGWNTQLLVCGGGTTTGACDNGRMCMPTAATPFDPGLCIARAGDHSCPPGAYTSKSLYFLDGDDTRGCSACSCGTPGGATCSALVEVHYNPSCSNLAGTSTNPGAECIPIDANNPPLSAKLLVTGTSGGECFPGGGQATGDVAPSMPVTVCCSS